MKIVCSTTALLFLLCGMVLAGDEGSRYLKKFQLPTGEPIVVSEGEFEPRSIGSYDLRVYSGANAEFPFDDFVVGVVRPRDGVVEDVTFSDLDGDGVAEIIIVMRSAGTGNYLSADAFQYKKSKLTLLGSVADLEPTADPVEALRQKIK